jgi:hypothetical protein
MHAYNCSFNGENTKHPNGAKIKGEPAIIINSKLVELCEKSFLSH